MQFSDSTAKIATALAKAQSSFKAIHKSGENKFDHYSYANLEDYVSAIRPILAANGLSVLSSVEEVIPLDDRSTKSGGAEHAVRCKLSIRIIHESGEWLEATSFGEGQDRGDKAVYKAITGARKYGLASALGLATSDDPEADEEQPAAQRQSTAPQKGDSANVLRSFISAMNNSRDLAGLEGVAAEITDEIKGRMTQGDLAKLKEAYREAVAKFKQPTKAA